MESKPLKIFPISDLMNQNILIDASQKPLMFQLAVGNYYDAMTDFKFQLALGGATWTKSCNACQFRALRFVLSHQEIICSYWNDVNASTRTPQRNRSSILLLSIRILSFSSLSTATYSQHPKLSNTLLFKEWSGSNITITVPEGYYNDTDLATALETAVTNGGSQTYTVTSSEVIAKVTIVGSSQYFTLVQAGSTKANLIGLTANSSSTNKSLTLGCLTHFLSNISKSYYRNLLALTKAEAYHKETIWLCSLVCQTLIILIIWKIISQALK